MKFDTIYDEYMDKQKMFSHLKSAVNKKDDDSIKQELETLKTKMDMLKKIQKVELKHAKEHAKKEADEMLKDKLEKCRLTYESEFENLCTQFTAMQKDLKKLKEDLLDSKSLIVSLEQVIT